MPKGIQEASISMAQEQNTKKKKQVGYNNKKKNLLCFKNI